MYLFYSVLLHSKKAILNFDLLDFTSFPFFSGKLPSRYLQVSYTLLSSFSFSQDMSIEKFIFCSLFSCSNIIINQTGQRYKPFFQQLLDAMTDFFRRNGAVLWGFCLISNIFRAFELRKSWDYRTANTKNIRFLCKYTKFLEEFF